MAAHAIRACHFVKMSSFLVRRREKRYLARIASDSFKHGLDTVVFSVKACCLSNFCHSTTVSLLAKDTQLTMYFRTVSTGQDS